MDGVNTCHWQPGRCLMNKYDDFTICSVDLERGPAFHTFTGPPATEQFFSPMKFKPGDYVQTRSRNKNEFLRGTVVAVGKKVSLRSDCGMECDYFEGDLCLSTMVRGSLFTPDELFNPEFETWKREFEQQHKAGVHYSEIWKGGDTRKFMAFCEFLKGVGIP